MLEDNKNLVRGFIEDVVNNREPDQADAVLATGCVGHFDIPGLESITGHPTTVLRQLHNAFPDWHTTINDMIAEGNEVVVRGTTRGTLQGEFVEITPTGNQVQGPQNIFIHIDDGKISEVWFYASLFGADILRLWGEPRPTPKLDELGIFRPKPSPLTLPTKFCPKCKKSYNLDELTPMRNERLICPNKHIIPSE